jgi:UDP-2-acetamido-2-deoxy-ribo-hexuluronate aminotransferase
MVDTTEIQEFCKEKNIIFIEDASQSLGSSLDGVKAGTIGNCSVYSFNSNKVIAGINGGGVFLTDTEEQAKLIQKIRRHGKDKDFELLGFNSRMYVLNAQIINLRLTNADKNQQKRNEIAQIYNQSFKDLPVFTQLSQEGLSHNYHKYTIRFQNKEIRKRVKDSLKASVHYEKPLSENSMYTSYKYRKDNCINSKLVSDTILSLPIHAWLTDDEISTIINTVKNNF